MADGVTDPLNKMDGLGGGNEGVVVVVVVRGLASVHLSPCLHKLTSVVLVNSPAVLINLVLRQWLLSVIVVVNIVTTPAWSV